MFYPITPSIAVLVSADFKENSKFIIDDESVLKYNSLILENAYSFVIGPNKDYIDFCWIKN